MEPFGLFEFLQSVLGQSPEKAPKENSAAPIENDKRTEETTPKVSAEPAPEMQADSTNQAILSFMQAHETRAKRIKKL